MLYRPCLPTGSVMGLVKLQCLYGEKMRLKNLTLSEIGANDTKIRIPLILVHIFSYFMDLSL